MGRFVLVCKERTGLHEPEPIHLGPFRAQPSATSHARTPRNGASAHGGVHRRGPVHASANLYLVPQPRLPLRFRRHGVNHASIHLADDWRRLTVFESPVAGSVSLRVGSTGIYHDDIRVGAKIVEDQRNSAELHGGRGYSAGASRDRSACCGTSGARGATASGSHDRKNRNTADQHKTSHWGSPFCEVPSPGG
jgi:hypothetical protein